MPPVASSSSRALNAILPLIASGQPYEAHQKARTFASRYAKSPASYDTAVDVLFQSARELLKAGQLGSGTDLASFMIDVYETKAQDVGDESRDRLTQLIALIGPAGTWRKTVIDKSIAWSASHGPYPAGDPELHHYIGDLHHKEGSLLQSEHHLLIAGKRESARLLAQVLSEWSKEGGEPGAFVLRGTLPYLLNGNILAARIFTSSFTTAIILIRPNLKSIIEPTPISIAEDEVQITTDAVLNFAQVAVRVCQRGQGTVTEKPVREAWIRLCGTYQSKGGILAAPQVRPVLNELASLYFGFPPPRSSGQNSMKDLLSSMFGGDPTGSGPPAPRHLSLPSAAEGLD